VLLRRSNFRPDTFRDPTGTIDASDGSNQTSAALTADVNAFFDASAHQLVTAPTVDAGVPVADGQFQAMDTRSPRDPARDRDRLVGRLSRMRWVDDRLNGPAKVLERWMRCRSARPAVGAADGRRDGLRLTIAVADRAGWE
jgi:hypothetical protein